MTRAITEQAGKLVHTSNLYGIPHQRRLADRLCELSGMERVFFCNSGAEANEAAIKIARLYGHSRDIDNPAIIVMENSFHGRTWPRSRPPAIAGCRRASSRWCRVFRVPYNDLEPFAGSGKQREGRGTGGTRAGRRRHQRAGRLPEPCATLR